MGFSLYDSTVAGFTQTLGAMSGVLDKGLAHCRQAGIDPERIVETRLHPDMLPFRFQVVSVVKHSLGAPPPDYAGLQAHVAEARSALAQCTREEIDALLGRELSFQPGSTRMRFTVENFLLSFSVPNLHFHATTAYDILRTQNVPLGKRDYLGQMRVAG